TAPKTSVPEEAIEIAPGESIQGAVDAAEEGAVFLLRSGIHRLQQVDPKTGQQFFGEEGTVLNGARLLDEFTREDGLWVHGGVEAEGEQRGTCASDRPTCVFPEDLFFDDQRLQRVDSVDRVDEDSWYLDYETDTLYLARDPTAAEVEVSVLPYAFGGD